MYWLPLSFTPALLLFTVALLVFTKISSTWRFRQNYAGKTITVAPYWLPGLYHLVPFLWNPSEFTLNITKRFGWEKPIRVKVANYSFTISSNPKHIQQIFKNSRFLSAKSITQRAARHLLDIPPSIMAFYEADDSGMAAEPRKGSKVAQENRILFQQTHTAQKFLASPYLEPLVNRFTTTFSRNVEDLGIEGDWVDHPDLFNFLQMTVARSNIEAMMGSKILDINPHLVQDFWTAKAHAPQFYQGLPRWVIPKAFKDRTHLVEGIKKWHSFALENGDYTNTGAKDPDWDPVVGSKYAKVRLQYMLKMKSLTADVRAAEDWGFVFGANGNTAPIIFWLMFEVLKHQDLRDRMIAEVNTCLSEDRTINVWNLANSPLLQSAYSEVLRLRVSILVSRMVEFADINCDGYIIPRNEIILMHTDALHYNEEAWTQAGRPSKTPLDRFDEDRFLVDTENGREYSLDGLAGIWIPFGGGDRMCPGRHLAQMEILFTFAFLFSNYDIEMGSVDTDQVKCDMRYAPYGALPPNRPVPFRMRRK
ncbi:cytochrome P450 [Ustulina deusta]|nr:cytochrome P450 [Ustulina deusta]